MFLRLQNRRLCDEENVVGKDREEQWFRRFGICKHPQVKPSGKRCCNLPSGLLLDCLGVCWVFYFNKYCLHPGSSSLAHFSHKAIPSITTTAVSFGLWWHFCPFFAFVTTCPTSIVNLLVFIKYVVLIVYCLVDCLEYVKFFSSEWFFLPNFWVGKRIGHVKSYAYSYPKPPC